MSERAAANFRASEVVVAVVTSASVLVGAGAALRVAALDRPADVREIDPGTAVPVKIVPVLDLDAPMLKLGGKHDAARLPDRWVRQRPVPRVEQKAFASTKAGKTEQDIPPPDVKVADAGTPIPPPSAEVAKQVDTPVQAVVDAGAPANVDTPGHADGVKEGTETDPLKARAVDLYRAKIAAWFSSRFGVHGSGLSPGELAKLQAHAVVQIGGGQEVAGYSLTPSGNPAFDAAAKAALESAKGQSLPPPPENYPDVAQSRISVTFVCRGKRCD